MGPFEGFAVYILLKQSLSQHEAEIFPRPPPGRIGRLVDDVAEIIKPPGRRGLVLPKPSFARLPTLPCSCRKPQDFDLDPAALKSAGQDVGASRRHRDRPAPHRARIVDQQRNHRVPEGRIFLLLERKRLPWIGDNPRQAGRIEEALLEVELPRTPLL